MKKISLVLLGLLLALPARALGIPEGAIVKTADNPDVYIVKYLNDRSYKRLILNPQVFASYGHLKWENLLVVDQAMLDAYATSALVRVDGQAAIYRLAPNGDTGSKALVSDESAIDADSVYIINAVDFRNYAETARSLSPAYEIAKVIDGDTLSVRIDGVATTVRLIGVDSPEVTSSVTAAECYGSEASRAAKDKLAGKMIRLESDPVSGDKDKYGRLLRYVYLDDGTLFNQWLVAGGYAREYTYAGQLYAQRDNFLTAQAAAQAAKKGLWNVEVCALAGDFFGDASIICARNTYNCGDFTSQAAAQRVYDQCLNQTGTDVHELDADDDGTVCESLN